MIQGTSATPEENRRNEFIREQKELATYRKEMWDADRKRQARKRLVRFLTIMAALIIIGIILCVIYKPK